ncbi:hypothetical protein [Clostridium sp. YIM B02506]|uniref:hypothetical protein n=1 Tax=Clostridium sp. YIM B02506 TaxID=2910680 RepID=UPI001EED130E|nr:hypothetical protein [Clostridium sp. YIM B02506]
MQKNSIGYSIITLLVLFITQIVIRNIGIENISVQAIVLIFVIACSLAIFGTYKDGKKGFGIRYNAIVTILLVVAGVTMSITMIIFRGYPILIDKYGLLLVIVSLTSYFALILFIIIYRIVYEVKRK